MAFPSEFSITFSTENQQENRTQKVEWKTWNFENGRNKQNIPTTIAIFVIGNGQMGKWEAVANSQNF